MRYRPLFLLGRGGMAEVYLSLAVAPNGFTRLVAAKSLREEFFVNAETQQMFLAEARLSARLNHPNVVQVSDILEAPRGATLVMEYLDGLSLRTIYAAGQEAFSLPMRLRVLCEVLAGLHYAHELTEYDGSSLGIVHRDVTPQNIFVTYDGGIKLLDFGIAKVTASHDFTQAGVIKGKVQYMPIEQLSGDKIDRRADIYAVGCLLWEAVAKSRMWPNQDRTQIMRSIIRGELPDLRDRVDVDPALGHIVSKAMARDPADRYATALEMRLALEQYMSAMRPVTAHDIGTLLRRAYGDPRSHRQHLIAEAIAKLGDEFKTHGGTDSGGTMDEGINASVTRPPPSIKPPRRVQNVLLPLVAALALIGVGWWAARAAQPAQDTNVAATSLRLERRTLTVRATPLDARVNVDGRYLEGNPASIAVAPGSEHALRVSASGYDPVERRLRVEHDTSVMLDLQPQPSAPAASSLPDPLPRGRRRPAADVRGRRPPAGSTSDEKPGCNPPYYYENGIKTYRPECI